MARLSKALPPDRELWTFGDWVYWHFFEYGTRPGADPAAQAGRIWEAEAVCTNLEIDEKTLRNWIWDKTRPNSSLDIEALLFGESPGFDGFRVQLRNALTRGRQARASRRASDALPAASQDATVKPDRSQTQSSGAEYQSGMVLSPETPRSTLDLIGRERELEQLSALLIPEKPASTLEPTRLALTGLGGIGKTSLARAFMRAFGNRYAGVWWARAETPTSLAASLANFRSALDPDAHPEPDTSKAAHDALINLRRQNVPWLLIYDNAPVPQEIEHLLPFGGATTLITSRHSAWSGWAEEIHLGALPVEASIDLLLKRSERADRAGAEMLAEALGYLPLSLEHAGGACRRFAEISFADYQRRLTEFVHLRPPDSPYPESVFTTFNLAIEVVGKLHRSAEIIMAMLSHCAPDRIPSSLLDAASIDSVDCLAARMALSDVSLIRNDPTPQGAPALSVHRLVQEVGRTRARARGITELAVPNVVGWLAENFPSNVSGAPERWPSCDELVPHVLTLASANTLKKGQRWSELIDAAGAYLAGRHRFAQAEPLLREALAICQGKAGGNHHSTATCLRNLAIAVHGNGNAREARQLVERALAIYATAEEVGPAHIDTANTAQQLAMLEREANNLDKAHFQMQRALQIVTHYHGSDSVQTAGAMLNLASIVQSRGAIDEAIKLEERAAAILEHKLTRAHPDTVQALNNLAVAYTAKKKYDQAEALFKEVLAVREDKLGAGDAQTALTANNLAFVYFKKGHFPEAHAVAMRAVEASARALSSEHAQTARFQVTLAEILIELNKPAEAYRLASSALAVLERALGPAAEWTRQAAMITGGALALLGRETEALAIQSKYFRDEPRH